MSPESRRAVSCVRSTIMTSDGFQAVALILCAATMNAAYALPMKLNKKWEWEHSWFAFSVLGVAVVPTIVAEITVPRLWSTYQGVSTGTLLAMVLFGAGWGVSLVFFGLALTRLGLAITFAVCLGTSAAVGALTPLIAQNAASILTRKGEMILLGIMVIIAGVILCGIAGRKREIALKSGDVSPHHNFRSGFILAFVSGVLGSMLNLGLAFGASIQRSAHEHGASTAMMSNAVWLPCLYAGFLPGAVYCYTLMAKKNSTPALRLPGTWYYWLSGASMGALWFGSIVLYSISTVKLGPLGTAIGWPLFLAAIVILSSFLGILSGEWKRTGSRPVQVMMLGVSLLVVAIVILSYAGRT